MSYLDKVDRIVADEDINNIDYKEEFWSEDALPERSDINTDYASENSIIHKFKSNNFPVNLEGGNYSYADFHKYNFPCANIMAVDLRYSNFEKVNLIGSNISYANFRGAKLKSADLEYAEINRSDFSFSDLSGANLQGANLIDSDFQFADLRHADLTDCLVNASNFYLSIYDEFTLLPFDLVKAKKLGMQFISSKSQVAA